ncbi:MAG TPA: hypothetical protein VFG23_21140, partial [Polyangia bacterium]|nr:hypothetical protein [Polyangia bacterium]
MVRATRFGWPAIPVAAMALALGGACGSPTPMDLHLGTTLGADFVAPVTDAGGDTAVDVTTTGGSAAGGDGGAGGAG